MAIVITFRFREEWKKGKKVKHLFRNVVLYISKIPFAFIQGDILVTAKEKDEMVKKIEVFFKGGMIGEYFVTKQIEHEMDRKANQ